MKGQIYEERITSTSTYERKKNRKETYNSKE
jgi:hypothetical protein